MKKILSVLSACTLALVLLCCSLQLARLAFETDSDRIMVQAVSRKKDFAPQLTKVFCAKAK